MSDKPTVINDQPPAPAAADAPARDNLADYRSPTSLQAKDVASAPKPPDELPSLVLSPHLERNAKGDLTSVQNSDGSVMKCGYGSIGELTSVTTKDGGSWVKEGFNRWDYFDKSGRDTGKQIADVMVNNETGAVEYFNTLQPQPGKVTRYSDIEFPNGTKVSMDINPTGTKTENVTFPNGDKQMIHYDKEGHPDMVQNGLHNGREAGCSWVKKDNIWTQYDDSGDTTGGKMPKGAWMDAGTGINSTNVEWINYPGGSSDATLINGDIVHRNDSGWITQVTDLNGKTEKFEYSNDGHVSSMTNKDGVTWNSVDGEWKQVDKKGKLSDAPVEGFNSVASVEGGDTKFLPMYL